jgi:tetratricopeptide (TPR) repeat protein
MPLALELAANSINILSPAELATELAHSLDQLATTMRHIPNRHRSIRAAFETSWQQLSSSEQSVFQKLSTFRGSFSREAAQAVANTSLPILTNLVNKSFIRFRQESKRYETHELMRQFGEEKLMRSDNQTKRTKQRHSAYFAEKLEQWAKEVKGAQQQKAFQEMAINSENIRLAWHWAVDHEQVEFLAQAIDGPGFLHQWQGRYLEGVELYRTACQMLRMVAVRTSDLNELLLKALTWHALFMHDLGQAESAIALFKEALKVKEDKPRSSSHPQIRAAAQAFLWHSLGKTMLHGSMRNKAKIYLDKSLAVYESLEDIWELGQVYNSLGILARELGDYPVAKELTEKSLVLRKEISDQRGLANSLGWLGLIAMDMGELDQSEAFTLQQLALNRELNSSLGVASSLERLGLLHLFRGQFKSAQNKFEDRLAILNNLGIQQKIEFTTIWLGIAHFNRGMYHKAQECAQTSLSMVEETGNLYAIGHAKMLLGYTKLALGEIDQARTHLNSCIELFQQLGQRDELSQAWAWMSYVELAHAKFQVAQTCLTTCLRTALDIRTLLPVMEALPAIAKLLVVQEEPELAIEIHTMAMQIPGLAKSIAFQDLVGQPHIVATELLPSEVVATAQERGRQRELWETTAELLMHFTETLH